MFCKTRPGDDRIQVVKSQDFSKDHGTCSLNSTKISTFFVPFLVIKGGRGWRLSICMNPPPPLLYIISSLFCGNIYFSPQTHPNTPFYLDNISFVALFLSSKQLKYSYTTHLMLRRINLEIYQSKLFRTINYLVIYFFTVFKNHSNYRLKNEFKV